MGLAYAQVSRTRATGSGPLARGAGDPGLAGVTIPELQDPDGLGDSSFGG